MSSKRLNTFQSITSVHSEAHDIETHHFVTSAEKGRDGVVKDTELSLQVAEVKLGCYAFVFKCEVLKKTATHSLIHPLKGNGNVSLQVIS